MSVTKKITENGMKCYEHVKRREEEHVQGMISDAPIAVYRERDGEEQKTS